jgi:hypothetical protein
MHYKTVEGLSNLNLTRETASISEVGNTGQEVGFHVSRWLKLIGPTLINVAVAGGAATGAPAFGKYTLH